MEGRGFSIGEAIKFGWRGMKSHFWLYFGFLLLAFLAALFFGMMTPEVVMPPMTPPSGIEQVMPVAPVAQPVSPMGPAGFLGWSLSHFLVNAFIFLGLTHVSLKVAQGVKPTFADFFNKIPLYFKFLGAEVLYWLIVAAGMILLVFPAFIWGTKYWLYPFMVVDKEAGPVEALELSGKATYGHKWDIFGYMIVSLLIYAAGAALLGVGLLAAIPLIMIGRAYIYRKLIGEDVRGES